MQIIQANNQVFTNHSNNHMFYIDFYSRGDEQSDSEECKATTEGTGNLIIQLCVFVMPC